MSEPQEVYASVMDEPAFDWNEFLVRENISKAEWVNADNLASCWVTCACGNQCSAIPRWSDGEPHDAMLTDLGVQFMVAIDQENREFAKDVLAKIERRSSEILADIWKEAQP